mgnify:CR=1 FL=1
MHACMAVVQIKEAFADLLQALRSPQNLLHQDLHALLVVRTYQVTRCIKCLCRMTDGMAARSDPGGQIHQHGRRV